jgi:hypothetical protein
MIQEPATLPGLFDQRTVTRLALIISICAPFLVAGRNLAGAAEPSQKVVRQTGEQLASGSQTRAPELPSAVSDRARVLLDANVPARRFQALDSLGPKLSENDLRLLYTVLLSKPPETGKAGGHEHVFKNELMNKLRHQQSPPTGLTDVLINVYRDRHQDNVVRDYALQHLAAWHERADSSDRNRIRQTLWSALSETQSSIAGTALLGLSRLAAEDPELKPDQIGKAALKLAASEECGELARVTALQVCSRLGIRQALPVAIQLAETAPSIPLRVSAIAAVADLGGAQARALLERLAAESSEPMKHAALSALTRLSDRSEP